MAIPDAATVSYKDYRVEIPGNPDSYPALLQRLDAKAKLRDALVKKNNYLPNWQELMEVKDDKGVVSMRLVDRSVAEALKEKKKDVAQLARAQTAGSLAAAGQAATAKDLSAIGRAAEEFHALYDQLDKVPAARRAGVEQALKRLTLRTPEGYNKASAMIQKVLDRCKVGSLQPVANPHTADPVYGAAAAGDTARATVKMSKSSTYAPYIPELYSVNATQAQPSSLFDARGIAENRQESATAAAQPQLKQEMQAQLQAIKALQDGSASYLPGATLAETGALQVPPRPVTAPQAPIQPAPTTFSSVPATTSIRDDRYEEELKEKLRDEVMDEAAAAIGVDYSRSLEWSPETALDWVDAADVALARRVANREPGYQHALEYQRALEKVAGMFAALRNEILASKPLPVTTQPNPIELPAAADHAMPDVAHTIAQHNEGLQDQNLLHVPELPSGAQVPITREELSRMHDFYIPPESDSDPEPDVVLPSAPTSGSVERNSQLPSVPTATPVVPQAVPTVEPNLQLPSVPTATPVVPQAVATVDPNLQLPSMPTATPVVPQAVATVDPNSQLPSVASNAPVPRKAAPVKIPVLAGAPVRKAPPPPVTQKAPGPPPLDTRLKIPPGSAAPGETPDVQPLLGLLTPGAAAPSLEANGIQPLGTRQMTGAEALGQTVPVDERPQPGQLDPQEQVIRNLMLEGKLSQPAANPMTDPLANVRSMQSDKPVDYFPWYKDMLHVTDKPLGDNDPEAPPEDRARYEASVNPDKVMRKDPEKYFGPFKGPFVSAKNNEIYRNTLLSLEVFPIEPPRPKLGSLDYYYQEQAYRKWLSLMSQWYTAWSSQRPLPTDNYFYPVYEKARDYTPEVNPLPSLKGGPLEPLAVKLDSEKPIPFHYGFSKVPTDEVRHLPSEEALPIIRQFQQENPTTPVFLGVPPQDSEMVPRMYSHIDVVIRDGRPLYFYVPDVTAAELATRFKDLNPESAKFSATGDPKWAAEAKDADMGLLEQQEEYRRGLDLLGDANIHHSSRQIMEGIHDAPDADALERNELFEHSTAFLRRLREAEAREDAAREEVIAALLPEERARFSQDLQERRQRDAAAMPEWMYGEKPSRDDRLQRWQNPAVKFGQVTPRVSDLIWSDLEKKATAAEKDLVTINKCVLEGKEEVAQTLLNNGNCKVFSQFNKAAYDHGDAEEKKQLVQEAAARLAANLTSFRAVPAPSVVPRGLVEEESSRRLLHSGESSKKPLSAEEVAKRLRAYDLVHGQYTAEDKEMLQEKRIADNQFRQAGSRYDAMQDVRLYKPVTAPAAEKPLVLSQMFSRYMKAHPKSPATKEMMDTFGSRENAAYATAFLIAKTAKKRDADLSLYWDAVHERFKVELVRPDRVEENGEVFTYKPVVIDEHDLMPGVHRMIAKEPILAKDMQLYDLSPSVLSKQRQLVTTAKAPDADVRLALERLKTRPPLESYDSYFPVQSLEDDVPYEEKKKDPNYIMKMYEWDNGPIAQRYKLQQHTATRNKEAMSPESRLLDREERKRLANELDRLVPARPAFPARPKDAPTLEETIKTLAKEAEKQEASRRQQKVKRRVQEEEEAPQETEKKKEKAAIEDLPLKPLPLEAQLEQRETRKINDARQSDVARKGWMSAILTVVDQYRKEHNRVPSLEKTAELVHENLGLAGLPRATLASNEEFAATYHDVVPAVPVPMSSMMGKILEVIEEHRQATNEIPSMEKTRELVEKKLGLDRGAIAMHTGDEFRALYLELVDKIAPPPSEDDLTHAFVKAINTYRRNNPTAVQLYPSELHAVDTVEQALKLKRGKLLQPDLKERVESAWLAAKDATAPSRTKRREKADEGDHAKADTKGKEARETPKEAKPKGPSDEVLLGHLLRFVQSLNPTNRNKATLDSVAQQTGLSAYLDNPERYAMLDSALRKEVAALNAVDKANAEKKKREEEEATQKIAKQQAKEMKKKQKNSGKGGQQDRSAILASRHPWVAVKTAVATADAKAEKDEEKEKKAIANAVRHALKEMESKGKFGGQKNETGQGLFGGAMLTGGADPDTPPPDKVCLDTAFACNVICG